MAQVDKSMSLANPHPNNMDVVQKIAAAVGAIGLLILFVAFFGAIKSNYPMWLTASLVLMAVGVIGYAWREYANKPAGIKNNHVWHRSLTNRGLWGWMVGILMTGFYILLYFYPALLGLGGKGVANTGIVALFDPISMALKGKAASEWFVYGTLYTLGILIFGFKFILKYWHNKYQLVRTISVMFFQLGFAFLIPALMENLNGDRAYFAFDIKNMWPLNYYFFEDWHLNAMLDGGNMGMFMLFSGIAMIFIVSPVLTYFYGKRWYCSWVCGCGGLAETVGDPFRQLSDKSTKAWKIERWLIHIVLVFITIVTVAVLFSYFKGDAEGRLWISPEVFTAIVVVLAGLVAGVIYFNRKEILQNVGRKVYRAIYIIMGITALLSVIALLTGSWNVFFLDSHKLKAWYGFFIGAIFSGVIGVGFYPLMGSRVWCRFGCPMAALLGLQQRFFSRFRITTNGGQCISCGNCSTYCEMGIDVRAYAQKGQNIVRASCVGCGICAAVCPRGVLRLENGSTDINERTDDMRTIHISADGIGILS